MQEALDLISKYEIIAVLAVLALIPLIHRMIFSIINKWIEEENDAVRVGVRKLKRPTLVLIVILGVSSSLAILDIAASIKENIQFYISLLGIASFAWLLIRSVNSLRLITLSHYDLSSDDNLKARKIYTQFRVLERIISLIIIIVAVGVILMRFETIKQVGVSLLASAGIAGIIIGLAAQKVIGNILAGFQIAITQPIRIDDVVIVENEWGVIEEITLTYVVVRIWDKRRLILPTPYFIEKPFQNWTRVSSDLMGTVFLHTDYRMPIEPLRNALTKILEKSPLWDGQVNVLQVTNASDKTIELRALMSAKNAPTAWDLRVHVREKLISYIQSRYPEYLPRTRVEITGEEK